MPSFTDFDLSPAVAKALEELGYETPTPVQQEAIPGFLTGKDIIAQAQTGTGKTAAFALPILTQIDLKMASPQAIVLAPTRELGIQVAEAFQSYAKHLKDFHVLPIYGGQPYTQQLRALKRGVHVIVGTPGRVIDHLKRGTINTENIKTVVLDEADEMLKMGFIDDVEWILQQIKGKHQTGLFSATMPAPIKKISTRYLTNPLNVEIKVTKTEKVNIEQCHVIVARKNKVDALTRLLEIEEFDGMIIFTRTKTASLELMEKLNARGFATAALNGDLTQQHREKVLKQLKTEKIDIIVATDVAARGIDIERITHVINYDAPYDVESYVHRIGRTGRAGREGKAILFISPKEQRILRDISRVTKQETKELRIPSSKEILKVRQTRFNADILEILKDPACDLTSYKNQLTAFCEESDIEPLDIAAALAYSIQTEVDDSKLDEPEQFSNDKPRRTRDAKRQSSEVEPGMVRCKVQLGRKHRITPQQIVGLIANKADISSKFIGEITIFDEFTAIDLDESVADGVLKNLGKIKLQSGMFHLTRSRS